MHKYLVDSAPNEREAQRLRRLAKPRAGAFVTAVPSEDDGPQAVMRPRVFRVAIAYRLGAPLLPTEIPCPTCMQIFDILGDHASCCVKGGGLVSRHNKIRNLVDKFATAAMLDPVMEKRGLLGDVSGRRPGDVTLRQWSGNKGLAIDVAVTCPFTPTSVRLSEPCETYASSRKHAKYDEDFKGSSFLFAALVFESTGAINAEGARVLTQIFRFAAQRLGKEFSSFCGRAWALFSCELQKSVAQSILSRCGSSDLFLVSSSFPQPTMPEPRPNTPHKDAYFPLDSTTPTCPTAAPIPTPTSTTTTHPFTPPTTIPFSTTSDPSDVPVHSLPTPVISDCPSTPATLILPTLITECSPTPPTTHSAFSRNTTSTVTTPPTHLDTPLQSLPSHLSLLRISRRPPLSFLTRAQLQVARLKGCLWRPPVRQSAALVLLGPMPLTACSIANSTWA